MDGHALKSCNCVNTQTSSADVVARHFVDAFENAAMRPLPFHHWLLEDVLPCWAAKGVTELPLKMADVSETYGKRDSHNASRQFFGTEIQNKFPVCAAIAEAFQNPTITRTISEGCEVDLNGSSLRVEYCQDGEGFWLEPHTDIGVKIFTMVLYLTSGKEGLDMGTDIYDCKQNHVGRAPSPYNSALIFIPSTHSWHGFEKRPMPTARKSLIINYVKPEWRARHELCFPENPIKG